jgi:predicted transcriptional regulator
MTQKKNILISLTPRHAGNVFAGTKTVELRRRPMQISRGTIAWIYVKIPVGAIIGCVRIDSIHIRPPKTLWRDFAPVSGLSKSEFFNYFDDVPKGTALEISNTIMFNTPLSLKFLKEHLSNFHPPQFFTNLNTDSPLLSTLELELKKSLKSSKKQNNLK